MDAALILIDSRVSYCLREACILHLISTLMNDALACISVFSLIELIRVHKAVNQQIFKIMNLDVERLFAPVRA